jgi:hypothetical protein
MENEVNMTNASHMALKYIKPVPGPKYTPSNEDELGRAVW